MRKELNPRTSLTPLHLKRHRTTPSGSLRGEPRNGKGGAHQSVPRRLENTAIATADRSLGSIYSRRRRPNNNPAIAKPSNPTVDGSGTVRATCSKCPPLPLSTGPYTSSVLVLKSTLRPHGRPKKRITVPGIFYSHHSVLVDYRRLRKSVNPIADKPYRTSDEGSGTLGTKLDSAVILSVSDHHFIVPKYG